MALIGLWPKLRDQLKLTTEVNTDNAAFKLVSKVSVGICLLATVLVSLDTLVGTTIECMVGDTKGTAGQPVDVVNQYCWVHGTKYIPESTWERMVKNLNISRYNPFCNINSVRHDERYVWMKTIFQVCNLYRETKKRQRMVIRTQSSTSGSLSCLS